MLFTSCQEIKGITWFLESRSEGLLPQSPVLMSRCYRCFHVCVFVFKDGWEYDYEGRKSFVTEVRRGIKKLNWNDPDSSDSSVSISCFPSCLSLTWCAPMDGSWTCTSPPSALETSSAALLLVTSLTGDTLRYLQSHTSPVAVEL